LSGTSSSTAVLVEFAREASRGEGGVLTEAQRVETERIACELDALKKRAEGSELRLIAFLIDIALSEARDELAHGECREGSRSLNSVSRARELHRTSTVAVGTAWVFK
jgi:hypothetical protein